MANAGFYIGKVASVLSLGAVCLFSQCFLSNGALYAEDDSRSALGAIVKQVSFRTLPNGLRVIMYRRGMAPVFSGVVATRVGGTDEVLGQTGISHMFEHMAFKGTEQIGTLDYQKEKPLLEELEKLMAAQASGTLSSEQSQRLVKVNQELAALWPIDQFTHEYDIRGASGQNATTDKELTKYFTSLPRSAFEFWCWIESERLLRPVMRQFYKERDVVMEEKRMRYENDPGGKLYETLLGMAFTLHPYRNPVIGYDFDISRITATQVDEFRKAYYVPSNIAVSIVGDVDLEKDFEIVERYFGRLAPGTAPAHPKMVEPLQVGERRFSVVLPASPDLTISYHKPVYPDPDDAALSVMFEMFAGGNTSPLYAELVKKTQVASDVGHEEAPGSAFPNLVIFSVTPKNPHTNEDALRVFDRVLSRFQSGGATQEQLEMAKRHIAMAYLGQLRSSMSLASNFAESELLYGNWKAMLDWYDQAMSVTLEQVNAVAKKYLQPSNRTIGTIEKAKEGGVQ